MATTHKYYAQKDALGFPIPGTMMAATRVPAVSNVIEISTQSGVTVFKGEHPEGLRYYVRVDNSGRIIPNSLLSGLVVPQGAFELGSGNKCITLLVRALEETDSFIELGLETYELENGDYVKGTINWGDGSEESEVNILDDGNTDWFEHTYSTAGIYTVTICLDRPEMIQDAEFGSETSARVIDVRNFNRWDGVDELDLTGARIETFVLNGNQRLDELYIDDSPTLTTVTVTNCPRLRSIDFGGSSQLTSIDFSGCPDLQYIWLSHTAINSQSIQALLTQLVNANVENGEINIQGENMIAPTGVSLAHIQTLEERGWNVQYNQGPSGVSYPGITPNEVFFQGEGINPLYISVDRGTSPFTYNVSPALPAGITINNLDGTISGAAESTSPLTTYTITVSNDFGSTSTTISFSVVELPTP